MHIIAVYMLLESWDFFHSLGVEKGEPFLRVSMGIDVFVYYMSNYWIHI